MNKSEKLKSYKIYKFIKFNEKQHLVSILFLMASGSEGIDN